MLIENLSNRLIEFSYHLLDYPEIINHANFVLKPEGILHCDKRSNFCYLKISDDYIYDIFSLLKSKIQQEYIVMPDYFTSKNNYIGAHISVVYSEESEAIRIRNYVEQNDSLINFIFRVEELISINVFNKTFIALTVICPELDEIRSKHGLPKKLNYHGLSVPFHITVAVSQK